MNERNTRRTRFITTFELILLVAALSYLAFSYITGDEPVNAKRGLIQDPAKPGPDHQSQADVELSLSMAEPIYEICCGRIPSKIKVWGIPTIKNTGDATAHNVRVTFGLQTLDHKTIKLSGEEQIEIYIGDLKSGESASETVEFTISLVDGYRVQDSGAVAVFDLYSDEKSFKTSEEFIVGTLG